MQFSDGLANNVNQWIQTPDYLRGVQGAQQVRDYENSFVPGGGIVKIARALTAAEDAAVAASRAANATGDIIKVGNMGDFFKNTEFGRSIKNSLQKTSSQYNGQSIYRVTSKVQNPYIKKGDGVYLDGMHKDHLEVVDSQGYVKAVLNLDGSYNEAKTEAALGRRVYWK